MCDTGPRYIHRYLKLIEMLQIYAPLTDSNASCNLTWLCHPVIIFQNIFDRQLVLNPPIFAAEQSNHTQKTFDQMIEEPIYFNCLISIGLPKNEKPRDGLPHVTRGSPLFNRIKGAPCSFWIRSLHRQIVRVSVHVRHQAHLWTHRTIYIISAANK